MWRTVPLLPATAMAAALAFAPSSEAQDNPGQKPPAGPAAEAPPGVGGVTVEAPRPPSKLGEIPADKKAAFDEQAARNEVWKRYRQSKPPADAGTLGQARDYPGLQTLAPPPDEGATVRPAAVP